MTLSSRFHINAQPSLLSGQWRISLSIQILYSGVMQTCHTIFIFCKQSIKNLKLPQKKRHAQYMGSTAISSTPPTASKRHLTYSILLTVYKPIDNIESLSGPILVRCLMERRKIKLTEHIRRAPVAFHTAAEVQSHKHGYVLYWFYF